jgi:hypothetical protein
MGRWNTAILTFEVVPVETAGQELLALAGNFVVACAAFDTWVGHCGPGHGSNSGRPEA